MREGEVVCPKCQHEMERGVLPDIGYGQVLQSVWQRGDPVKRGFVGGIKGKRSEQIPIVAYRCTRCGLVEMYAPE